MGGVLVISTILGRNGKSVQNAENAAGGGVGGPPQEKERKSFFGGLAFSFPCPNAPRRVGSSAKVFLNPKP